MMVTCLACVAAVQSAHTQPTVRLGAPVAATPHDFVQPIAIRELPDGTLLISDQIENRLVHYNFANRAATDIGRTGSGPGEYRAVGWLHALGADSSLLTDAYTGRWFVLVGTKITKTFAEQEPANLLLRGRLDGASRDGHVISTQAHIYAKGARRFPSTADTFVLIRANWRTVDIDTVARLLGPGDKGYTQFLATPTRLNHVFPTNPLAAAEKGLLLPDGWIAVARLRPYRVDWRQPNGQWIRGTALPTYVPRATTARDKCFTIQVMVDKFSCETDTFNGWPDVVPPFVQQASNRIPTLLADIEGNVLVERLRTVESPTRRYDVVDRQARIKRIILLGPKEQIIGFGARHVYVVHTDDDDLKSIRKHMVPWAASGVRERIRDAAAARSR